MDRLTGGCGGHFDPQPSLVPLENFCSHTSDVRYSEAMVTLLPGLLWTDSVQMKMAGVPAGRRMTVCRGGGGQIVVFSPLPCSDENVAKIRDIGEPAAFIVPSRFHDSFFDDYFERFPKSVFLAGKAAIRDHPRWRLVELMASRPELGDDAGVQEVGHQRSAGRGKSLDLGISISSPEGTLRR